MRRVIGFALLVAWGIASSLIAKPLSTGADMSGEMPIQVATFLTFFLVPGAIFVVGCIGKLLWHMAEEIGDWVLHRRSRY
jgi:hypothetical protein